MRQFLLGIASSCATLAAARSLGRAGIPVVVADGDRFAPACWSRYVQRSLRCPDPTTAPEAFVAWLLRQRPGRVLYPSNDTMALLLARERERLGRVYELYVPPFEVVFGLLDKWRLFQTCRAVGVDAPWTSLEPSRDAPFPLVVKPRTQALLSPYLKGRLVREPAALEETIQLVQRTASHHALLRELEPAIGAPLLQAFDAGAAHAIENVSGFIDASGELFVAQCSRKVLQWPARVGVGICFEELPARPELLEPVRRLCRATGYFGAFEVEFVVSGGRPKLIDFNPRFYGQMAFDVARGLELPLMIYFASLGDREALRDLSRAPEQPDGRAYCNRIELELALPLLRAAQRMTREERRDWRGWLTAHRARLTDSMLDEDDPLPAALQGASALAQRARHPRAYWRAAREL